MAMTVAGPFVQVEHAQTGTREEASAPIPVPVRVLDGMFVLGADYAREQRPGTTLSALGLTALFLPHAKEGAPKAFFEVGRYGHPTPFRDAKPMVEATVGGFASGPDLPAWTRTEPNDEVTVQLALQVRSFPGFREWYPDARYRLQKASGWFVDLEGPVHVLAGYEAPAMAWAVYGGVRWDTRAYPVAQVGWLDGYAESRIVGVRYQISSPLHVALEAGYHREWERLLDEQGRKLATQNSALAPWARLALETWIRTP